MKKLLLLNWPAKLFCLVLAVIIWYVLEGTRLGSIVRDRKSVV